MPSNSLVKIGAILTQSRLVLSLIWPFPLVSSAWGILTYIGIFMILFLAIALRPKDFPVTRREILIGIFITLYFCFQNLKVFSFLTQVVYSAFPKTVALGSTSMPLLAHRGGYASLGMFFTALLTTWILTKKVANRITFLGSLDYFCFLGSVGLVFTRVGCFIAGCCYGKPIGPFLRSILPFIPSGETHPTQLYSIAINIITIVVSRLIYRNRQKFREGTTFFGTMLVYCVLRFIVEGFRGDSVNVLGNITLAQLTFLYLSWAMWSRLRKINKRI
ncbi:MAG: prolipoprotein diacylglyceryl transferase [Candidatus Omnitrophica bacterium]|nr:prolipoprotein diacylglyceryl transferase [Candidatus Omnitrophota bacterium]